MTPAAGVPDTPARPRCPSGAGAGGPGGGGAAAARIVAPPPKNKFLSPKFLSPDPTPIADRPEYDPSFGEYLAAYSVTFSDYARRGLGYESLLPYEVLSNKVHPWKFGEPGTGYLNVADDLARAMVRNPRMRVLVASGYYDLATPYRAASYSLDHLSVGRELRGNIRETFYEGGHMMYHNAGSLAALHEHVAEFMAGWR